MRSRIILLPTPPRIPRWNVLVVLILASSFATSIAFARIANNTIDPVATVTDGGRHIVATGPISCAQSEKAYLRVTVTQRSTGAVAEGRALVRCTPDVQQWEVHASVQGEEAFEAGAATAVALARSADRGETTDAHQWLVDIMLIEE